MPDSEQVIEAYRDHVNRSFALLAKVAGSTMEVSASGAVMRDEKGQDYLQCGGFGVLTLGHSHPKVVEAAERQLRPLPLTRPLPLSAEPAAPAEAPGAASPPGPHWGLLLR